MLSADTKRALKKTKLNPIPEIRTSTLEEFCRNPEKVAKALLAFALGMLCQLLIQGPLRRRYRGFDQILGWEFRVWGLAVEEVLAGSDLGLRKIWGFRIPGPLTVFNFSEHGQISRYFGGAANGPNLML